jgi:hypothetical protein
MRLWQGQGRKGPSRPDPADLFFGKPVAINCRKGNLKVGVLTSTTIHAKRLTSPPRHQLMMIPTLRLPLRQLMATGLPKNRSAGSSRIGNTRLNSLYAAPVHFILHGNETIKHWP